MRLFAARRPASDADTFGDYPNVPQELCNMNNHPSRSPSSPSRSPTPDEVKAGRKAANLQPDAAGELVHERGARWLQFEHGLARMHPATWELFKLKTGQV